MKMGHFRKIRKTVSWLFLFMMVLSALFLLPSVRNMILSFAENFIIHRKFNYPEVWSDRIKYVGIFGIAFFALCFFALRFRWDLTNFTPLHKTDVSQHNLQIYLTENQLFCFAFAFFLFMMLFNLTHSSLWGDEWVEYNVSQKNVFSMYESITHTFQPPLYNFLMHFWLQLGNSILWFRLFNVFIGVFAGVSLYSTTKMLTNYKYASATLFVLGATYHWVYCIQECSEYALMLTFLFFAIHFYVRATNENSLRYEILFILSCTGAMYSQYGAFFIVLPLLLLHFIRKYLSKTKKEIVTTLVMYVFSLVIFVLPLYLFFAKGQLKNNAIAENSNIVVSLRSLIDFFLVFGKLLGYFTNLNRWGNIMIVVGIIIVIAAIVLLTRKSLSWTIKSLIITLLFAYVMFYWLVTFHIYAMVHPNQSSGYYTRYAYFFIPTLYVIVPMILYHTLRLVKKPVVMIWVSRVVLCIIVVLFLAAYPSILENWHKTYDKEFAEIWINNAGFKDTTYLIGASAKPSFDYYTNRYKYKMTGEIIYAKDIDDLGDLRESFWIWRSDWSGDIWKTIMERAIEQGYEVIVYADYQHHLNNGARDGQLVYCRKF